MAARVCDSLGLLGINKKEMLESIVDTPEIDCVNNSALFADEKCLLFADLHLLSLIDLELSLLSKFVLSSLNVPPLAYRCPSRCPFRHLR